MKTIHNFVENQRQKILVFRAQLRCGVHRLNEILTDERGASAIEIAGAAVMAIVLICILINAFTGIFSDTIIPGIQDKIKGIFSMA
ncbi:hypothetical protein [Clostridium sp. KNHs216]|uniref:hypothetical protein n=1 Tax=Clostridium sp. KNHs216 TaxID=1550235 RepID=UPI001154926D|nr:hypothetical protein [Clostridium sp. KNHs216]TQI68555.1 hypothetical protein LY85_3294 [Clostridium sp. KNHs216]